MSPVLFIRARQTKPHINHKHRFIQIRHVKLDFLAHSSEIIVNLFEGIKMPRQPPGNKTDYISFYKLPTRWMDNDQYGHMNNVIHYSLIDTVVTNWQLDQGIFDESGNKIRFLVVESGCIYHSEAGYPDMIHAGLRVGQIGNSSWRYEVGLFRNAEINAFAEGYFVQVLIDSASSKPKNLSLSFRARLKTLVFE